MGGIMSNIMGLAAQAQQSQNQDWDRFGKNLGNILRIRKLKKANKMIHELGGLTEENLRTTIQKCELSGEQIKEFLAGWKTVEEWKTKNQLNQPVSEAIRARVGQRYGLELPENATLAQAFNILKLFPEEKQKEWGSQATVDEKGSVLMMSDKPGTKGTEGFTLPSFAGKTDEARLKTKTAEDKAITEKQKAIRMSLEKALASYYDTMGGVGTYVADPNKQQLARQRRTEVVTHAKNYIKSGGTIEDLGYESIAAIKRLFTGKDDVEQDIGTLDTEVLKQLEQMILEAPGEDTDGGDVKKKLEGKPPGIYKVDGKKIKWNGIEVIK